MYENKIKISEKVLGFKALLFLIIPSDSANAFSVSWRK
jgi:hypothetical protein